MDHRCFIRVGNYRIDRTGALRQLEFQTGSTSRTGHTFDMKMRGYCCCGIDILPVDQNRWRYDELHHHRIVILRQLDLADICRDTKLVDDLRDPLNCGL